MDYITPVERLREYLLADMDLVDTATLQVLICALRVMIEARKEEIRKMHTPGVIAVKISSASVE